MPLTVLVGLYDKRLKANDFDAAAALAWQIARTQPVDVHDVAAKLDLVRRLVRPDATMADDEPAQHVLMTLADETRALDGSAPSVKSA